MLADSLRTRATSAISGLTGPYKSLADLGITTGPVGSQIGTTNDLVIDEAKFQTALSANPQAVYDALDSSTPGSVGVFQNLRSYLNNATLPGGLVPSLTESANKRQSDLDTRIAQRQRLLDMRQTQLQAQFSRMESALSQIQAQGQQLQAQLGANTTAAGK
jgi:flagellar hook-associated protein 2